MAVVVQGVPQTIAAFARVGAQVKVAAPVASKAGGEVLAALMRAAAPKRTGRLAASIRTAKDGDTTIVGADVPYDRFVQLGTVNMEPQAYGEEAVDTGANAITAAMTRIIQLALR